MNACYQRIYEIVAAIPRGRVMTYGQIARLAGGVCLSPVPAIQVGRALAACGQFAPDLPWWRVIGQSGPYGLLRKQHARDQQRDLLAREGILPDAEERYDLARYRWEPAA